MLDKMLVESPWLRMKISTWFRPSRLRLESWLQLKIYYYRYLLVLCVKNNKNEINRFLILFI